MPQLDVFGSMQQGYEFGNQINQRNALMDVSQGLANNDYQGATQAAGRSGNPQLVAQIQKMQQEGKTAELAAAKERSKALRQVAAKLATMPEDQIQQLAPQIAQALEAEVGIPAQQAFKTLTDPQARQAAMMMIIETDDALETFGTTPQFVRSNDGSVKAVQFGNKGSIRQQDAGGLPIQMEQRYEALDQGRDRIALGYYQQDPNLKGAQGYASGYGRETGTRAAGAQFDLPGVQQSAEQTIGLIDQATGHEGFNSRYGLRGALLPAIPGTDGADMEAIREQLKGKAFLQAFESLKGGGAISEKEGAQATNAISRIFDPRQSPEAARQAYAELRDIVARGVAKAEAKAATPNPYGGGEPQRQAPAPQQPQGQDDPLGIRY